MTEPTWTTYSCCGDWEQWPSQEEAFDHAHMLMDADGAHQVHTIEAPTGEDLIETDAFYDFCAEKDLRWSKQADERRKNAPKLFGHIEVRSPGGGIYKDASYSEEALTAEYARYVGIYGEDRVKKVIKE